MAPEPPVTLLIQFARAPVPGAVKTRMLPTLSPREACELHEELLLWTCRSLLRSGLGPVELWVSDETRHPVFATCLESGAIGPRLQRGADLGQRMHHALQDGLRRYGRVLLVGSDCPGLDADYLHRAVNALASVDCVLGPAQDGGYVLVGARRIKSACFEGIDWGTSAVYSQSIERLEDQGLSWQALETRRDIDRPEDLPVWRRCQRDATVENDVD